jgi:peptidoglycan/xylan/chitin deacetylase (PgdA/CDA1 family)
VKKIFKIILSFLANACGLIILKQFFFISQNKKLCLMYHRVLPSMQANTCEPGMYVTPQVFDMHLRQLAKRFHLCSLQEMCQFASLEKFKHPVKPLCSLTFDDGWRDFYQFVFPLLVKYSIPATIFLPTFFIGTEKKFWQDSVITIAESLVGTEKVSVSKFESCSMLAKDIHCLLSGGDGVDAAIEKLKKEKLNIIRGVLEDLYKMIPSKSQVIDERDFLSWYEIQEMKDSGFVQFGSHTHTHQILTTLEPDDVRCELEISKTILLNRDLVDPLFVPFCYPNGNYNDEIIGMVREAGYHMAVTTKRGRYLKGDSLFTIKRIGVHNDISYTIGLFLCRILGIL